jgi:hypothetical protein
MQTPSVIIQTEMYLYSTIFPQMPMAKTLFHTDRSCNIAISTKFKTGIVITYHKLIGEHVGVEKVNVTNLVNS